MKPWNEAAKISIFVRNNSLKGHYVAHAHPDGFPNV